MFSAFLLYKNLIFSLPAKYFMIWNIFVQSWQIWATFNTANDNFVSSKVPFAKLWFEICSYKTLSKMKNVLTKHFPKMQPFTNVLKIGILINFPIFTRKYLCWGLFSITLQAWWPATLLKKRPQHRCFPVNITKSLRIAFLWNTSGSCFWKR